MPRSAIDTGMVDYILPAEQMAAELIRYVQHPYLGGQGKKLPADKSLSSRFSAKDSHAGPGQHQA